MTLSDQIKKKDINEPEGVRKIYEAVMKPGRTLIITDLTIPTSGFEIGTLFVNTLNNDFTILTETGRNKFTPSNLFETASITGSFIADETLKGTHLINETISPKKIMPYSLTSLQIEDRGIQGRSIADNTITRKHLTSSCVDETALDTYAVTSIKIALGNVTGAHIAKDTITNDLLEAHTIDETRIKVGSIVSETIRDEALKESHFSLGCITSDKIKEDQISSIHLKDFCITQNKIKEDSILPRHFAQDAVDNRALGLNAVATINVQDEAITLNKIEEDMRKRILNALQVNNGVANVDRIIANTIEILKDLAAKNIAANQLNVLGNTAIQGQLSVMGDIRTAGRVYNAVYNDIAEGYVPGEKLEIGDIVEIRNDHKVYKAKASSSRIVGVVSNQYAHCLGATLEEVQQGRKVPIGLIGKLPVKVFGRTSIGQTIVCKGDGIGAPVYSTSYLPKIGKAIEAKTDEGTDFVQCLIFPN